MKVNRHVQDKTVIGRADLLVGLDAPQRFPTRFLEFNTFVLHPTGVHVTRNFLFRTL